MQWLDFYSFIRYCNLILCVSIWDTLTFLRLRPGLDWLVLSWLTVLPNQPANQPTNSSQARLDFVLFPHHHTSWWYIIRKHNNFWCCCCINIAEKSTNRDKPCPKNLRSLQQFFQLSFCSKWIIYIVLVGRTMVLKCYSSILSIRRVVFDFVYINQREYSIVK